MHKRVQFEDFNEKWKKQVQQSESLRMHDDQAEQDFWKRFMAQKSQYAPDASSRPIAAYLQQLIVREGIQSVIELGPGWGNYTLDLARACKEVTCVDISQDVLHYIEKIAHENSLTNIQSVYTKWEDFSSSSKYDLVFGYNCFYRLENLATAFWKMNEYANKLCVVGMNTGIAPAWIQELYQNGAEVFWEWKDYIYFVNVLYQMGIDPEVRIFPFTKELCYESLEALVAGECSRLKPGTYDPKTAEKILLRYFKQNEDGNYTAHTSFRGGFVMWRPVTMENVHEG